MSDDAYREQRNRKNREKWQSARMGQLRASLQTHVGKTLWLDLTTSTNQLATRVLGQLVVVREGEVEVIDLSDATVPPNAKPRRVIGIGQIRDWRQA